MQTFVTEWDDAIVREAVLHEAERGGRSTSSTTACTRSTVSPDRLRELVPEVSFVVAHGQMPEMLLKRVMERFADGEFDVLVCTTIIESGIDIPEREHADHRSCRQAGVGAVVPAPRARRPWHAPGDRLPVHPRDRVLTEEAQQRLATIFEANELGAGFQVALRDLEIRGAGNLLGAEQSGQIASVGFDLYTQMLAEAVESLKAAHEGREAEPVQARPDRGPSVDLPLSAFIPEPYIEDIESRLALYQRIASLSSREQADALRGEVADRFGALPEPLDHLFSLVALRLAARAANVASLRLDGDDIVLTAGDESPFATRSLPDFPAGVRVGRTQLRVARAALGEDWLEAIEALLRLLAGERELVPAVRR